MNYNRIVAEKVFELQWGESESERFYLEEKGTNFYDPNILFYIGEDGLCAESTFHPKYTVEKILRGEYEIVKLPQITIPEKIRKMTDEQIADLIVSITSNASKSCNICNQVSEECSKMDDEECDNMLKISLMQNLVSDNGSGLIDD